MLILESRGENNCIVRKVWQNRAVEFPLESTEVARVIGLTKGIIGQKVKITGEENQNSLPNKLGRGSC